MSSWGMTNSGGFKIVPSSGHGPIRLTGHFNIVSYDIIQKLVDNRVKMNFKVSGVTIAWSWLVVVTVGLAYAGTDGTPHNLSARWLLPTSLITWKMQKRRERLLVCHFFRSDAFWAELEALISFLWKRRFRIRSPVLHSIVKNAVFQPACHAC